uniref:Uncharacterized protein n=1 Tax=Rhizophora mucronata TaxID=61149 RepID=A0A2P2PMS0_RHIMU
MCLIVNLNISFLSCINDSAERTQTCS